MIYLAAVVITTICSLLHDSDNPAAWITKYFGEEYGKWFGKPFVVALHGMLLWVLADLQIGTTIGTYTGLAASLASVGIFWGVFRRGWMAKAELTAIRLKDEASINAIVKAYPPYLGYISMIITQLVLKLPDNLWYRRIQSGLIALLWTAPISSLPILLLGAL